MNIFLIPDIQRIICKSLNQINIIKIVRLNKKMSQILFDNFCWNIWGDTLKEETIKNICNHPLFPFQEYTYCKNYYIFWLETIIYNDKLYNLWDIANITKIQLRTYIDILQYYYILCEDLDKKYLFKLYFNYENYFPINSLPENILKEIQIPNLLFQEFYYQDYHVIIKNFNNIIINNRPLPVDYYQNIKNSELILDKIIMLFSLFFL